MASTASTSALPVVKELAQKTTQANKEHQYALKVYSERLEAELEAVDKLLAAADISDNEDELEIYAGGTVVVQGSIKLENFGLSNELSAQHSPFYADAMRRQRYINATTVHPMRAPELEALTEAVRSENRRIQALQAQFHGYQPFQTESDQSPDFLLQNTIGIDWERVATKVSSSKSADVQRSAKECEVRWLGDRHPRFNHAQWFQPEIARVRELVAGIPEGQIDWMEIATKLGTGRTPIDCMRHAIVRRTHSWDEQSDERLLAAVNIYGTDNWSLARTVSEDATPAQCQNRWMRTLDPSIKRGAWTEEEDKLLRRAVAVFGHSWMEVATFVPGRNNEQCRDRYNESLHPNVMKGKWTEEEDAALLEAVQKIGENKWKEVSQSLNTGRTDNMCRNRYYGLRKRKAASAAASPAPSEPSTSGNRDQPKKRAYRKTKVNNTESTPASVSDAASPAPEAPIPKPRPRPKPRPLKKPIAELPKDGAPQESVPDESDSGNAVVSSSRTETTEQLEEVEPTVEAETPAQKPKRGSGKGGKRSATVQEEGTAESSRPMKRRKTTSQPPDDTQRGTAGQDDVSREAHDEPAVVAGQVVVDGDAEGELSNDVPGEDAGTNVTMTKPSRRGGMRGKGRGRGRGKPPARNAGRVATASAVAQPSTSENTRGPDDGADSGVKSGGRRGRKTVTPVVQPTRRQPARGKAKNSNNLEETAVDDDSGIPSPDPSDSAVADT